MLNTYKALKIFVKQMWTINSWPESFSKENKPAMKEPRLSQELSSNERNEVVVGSRNYTKEIAMRK